MDPDQVLILAPDGAPRAALEEVFLRLDRSVTARHPASSEATRVDAAVIVADLREADDDMRPLAEALWADARPLMIVADRPSPLLLELQNRPGGLALLTGAESEAGFRVALRVCEALAARELAAPALSAR